MTKKQKLSKELNWLLFRVKGSYLGLHYRDNVPTPLKELLDQYNSMREEIIATVSDPEFRDVFYKANGVEK